MVHIYSCDVKLQGGKCVGLAWCTSIHSCDVTYFHPVVCLCVSSVGVYVYVRVCVGDVVLHLATLSSGWMHFLGCVE